MILNSFLKMGLKSDTEIKPRLVNGEPLCSNECPCFSAAYGPRCRGTALNGCTCWAGVRQQRDELQKMLDKAIEWFLQDVQYCPPSFAISMPTDPCECDDSKRAACWIKYIKNAINEKG
jgi:hypothetical protein